MYLDDLRNRLVELVKRRVRSGLATERGLARAAGLSQPHLHNVLKGVRSLTIESADLLLLTLRMDVADLMLRLPAERELGTRAVPLLTTRIGPGITPRFNLFAGYRPVPLRLVQALVEPVLGQVAPDLSLPVAVQANDTILLDQNPVWRIAPLREYPYVIYQGDNAFIRFVRIAEDRLYLSSSPNIPDLPAAPSIPLPARDILETVRARIVWISREIGTTPPGSP